MSKRIEIPMALETSGIAKGAKDAERALDDLESATGTTGKKGAADLDKIESELKDVQAAGEGAGQGVDGVGEKIGKTGGITRAMAMDVKQASNALIDFGTGKPASAMNNLLGATTSLMQIMPGIGLGVVVGSTLINEALNGVLKDASEKAAELRAQANEIASEAFSEGVDTSAFLTSLDEVIERVKTISDQGQQAFRWFWEDDRGKLGEFNDDLRRIGETQLNVTDIFSMSDDNLQKWADTLRKGVKAASAEYDAITSKGLASTDAERERLKVLEDQMWASERIISNVEDEIGVRKRAAQSAEDYAEAGQLANQAVAEAEEAKATAIEEATQRVQESVTAAYDAMEDEAREFATSEEGALDIQRWLDYITEHQAAIQQYEANLQALKMSPEDWTALMAMPEDARTQWVAQVAALPEEARKPFIDALDGTIGNAAKGASVTFEDGFTPEADVEVTVDDTVAVKTMRDLTTKAYEATVKVKVDTAAWDNWRPTAKRARVTAEVDGRQLL